MTVTSGRKCCELYRKSGPLGSLVRMLLVSSAWRSTRCYLTWKASATPAKRLLFRLVPSMPRTDATALPLWATPNTMDYLPQRSPEALQRQAETSRKGRTRPANLREQVCEETVRLWPTPTARDSKGANSMEHLTRDGKRNHTDQLANAVRMWPTPTAEQCGMTATTGGRPIEKSTNLSTQVYLEEQRKLIPTPTARCGQAPCIHGEGGMDLATYAKLIPTATTGAGMCGGSANYQRLKEMEDAGVITAEERRSMASGNGGQLNPTWVEWLMGFPLGWTDLSVSETQSCPSSSTQSSGQ